MAEDRFVVGTRIREKRIERGLRQADLAARAGISPSYLNLIEHNRRRIAGHLLTEIASALGIEAGQLTGRADSRVLERLAQAVDQSGAERGDVTAELSRIEEFADRFPDWAGLMAAQQDRIDRLEARLARLSDRIEQDPELSASLHDVVSTVTAIRSTAAILADGDPLDADWQARFHTNLYADSLRLVESSTAVVNYLEGEDTKDPTTAPEESRDLDDFVTRTQMHVPSLENGFVDGGSNDVLAQVELDYARCAQTLPLNDMRDAIDTYGVDPLVLTRALMADPADVLMRLVSLPSDWGLPQMGYVETDAAGAFRLIKPVAGFEPLRTVPMCPLWPIFGAFAQPGRLIRQVVDLPQQRGTPGPRYVAYAIATYSAAQGYDAPPRLFARMLVCPEPVDPAVPAHPVGLRCRVCPRATCDARREDSILSPTEL